MVKGMNQQPLLLYSGDLIFMVNTWFHRHVNFMFIKLKSRFITSLTWELSCYDS